MILPAAMAWAEESDFSSWISSMMATSNAPWSLSWMNWAGAHLLGLAT
jgi:hypothetical protein